MKDKIKYLVLILAVISGDYILDVILAKFGIIFFLVPVVGLLVAGAIYLKKYTNHVNIIQLMFLLANCVLYISTRMTVAALKSPLDMAFGLTAKQSSLYPSLMSMGYGLMQFATGILLTRFGLNYTGVSAIMYGILQISMSNMKSYNMILFARVLLGFSAASTVISVCTFLTSVFPSSLFSILFNMIIFIAYKMGAVCDLIASKSLELGQIQWYDLLRRLGYAGIILGVIIIITNRFTSKISQQEVKESTTETINEPEEGGLKYFFTTPKLLFLGLYSWSSVVLLYVFQNGYFANIVSEIAPTALKGSITYLMNSVSGVYSLILPFLILIFGVKSNLYFAGISGIVGVFTYLLIPSLGTLKLAAIGIAILGMSHSIAPLIIADEYGNSKYAGIYFGMLNGFAMFPGCSLSQLGSGFLLSFIWTNQGSPLNEMGERLYNAAGITQMLWYLSISVIASAIFIFLATRNKKSETSYQDKTCNISENK